MKTIGLDLGGTKIAGAVVEDGKILLQHRRKTPRTGGDRRDPRARRDGAGAA